MPSPDRDPYPPLRLLRKTALPQSTAHQRARGLHWLDSIQKRRAMTELQLLAGPRDWEAANSNSSTNSIRCGRVSVDTAGSAGWRRALPRISIQRAQPPAGPPESVGAALCAVPRERRSKARQAKPTEK